MKEPITKSNQQAVNLHYLCNHETLYDAPLAVNWSGIIKWLTTERKVSFDGKICLIRKYQNGAIQTPKI
jgi:hypothetical protein